MTKQFNSALLLFVLSVGFFYLPAMAKEDSAQITLKKPVISKQNLRTYTVKQGDMISSIIRNIPNISEGDIQDYYKLIKELNPDISDIDKLTEGQILIIPEKQFNETEQDNVEINTVESDVYSTPPSANSASINAYAIKKGDTLIKIIHRELEIKTDTRRILKIIQSMNPNITNVDRIYAGRTIKLPDRTVFVKAAEENNTLMQELAQQPENQNKPQEIVELEEKIVMPPEARLAFIKHVITQLNGSVMTVGNYYLPLPKTGQVTIDCSKIPVIELDDQTMIFLDLDNRAENNLKTIINNYWANYHLIKIDKKDDVIAILKKVFATTKGYSMTKRDKPMSIGSLPPVDVFVDWVITKSNPKQAQPLMQGLRIVYENNPLLPKSIINYAQKNGFIITEFSEETGITEKPEEIYSLPPMPVFSTTSVKDFSFELLTYLDLKADKDADVKVFDMNKDGFNLSIKADVLVTSADKRYIIHSQNLPQQFVDSLKKAGTEIIFIADNDSPKAIIEKILPSFNITFSSGSFTFSGIDKNQAPYVLRFSGTKIKTDNDLYIVDFEIDQGLRSLLREVWTANIARY